MTRLKPTIALALLTAGCNVVTTIKEVRSGDLEYVPPTATTATSNTDVVDKPFEILWEAAAAVFNGPSFRNVHQDKAGGVITATHLGNPLPYVDCGLVEASLKKFLHSSKSSFAGAAAYEGYEAWSDSGLVVIKRWMSLQSTIKLRFEKTGPGQTRLTADVGYVVTREVHTRAASAKEYETFLDSISFNSGELASFPPGDDGRSLDCRPTGKLEVQVLSLVAAHADGRR